MTYFTIMVLGLVTIYNFKHDDSLDSPSFLLINDKTIAEQMMIKLILFDFGDVRIEVSFLLLLIGCDRSKRKRFRRILLETRTVDGNFRKRLG